MRHGITILEVLVVLVLVLFAAGLAVVFISHHRENALRLQCRHNLKQIGDAIHAYEDNPVQSLPPSRIAEGYATWAVLLAPHLAKEHPLQQWDVQTTYFAQNDEVREARIVVFFCPARTRTDTLSESGDIDKAGVHVPGALGDYACVAGDGATDWMGPDANGALMIADLLERKGERILKWQSRTGLGSLRRGAAYTLIVGEKHVPVEHMGAAEFGDGSLYNGQNPASFARIAGPGFPLGQSIDAPFNKNFGSYHNGICNFLMADTSVRPMAIDVSDVVLGELARRGE